jgi:competence ComEA-like helix-hairpin-helix protein
MKKREADGRVEGGLLLLFSLLLVYFFCSIFCRIAGVDVQGGNEAHKVCTDEMTAFQKITLGMPVSINAEGLEGLTAVPGIGPKIAEWIILEREKSGGFKSIEDLRSIKGIGPAVYGKIRPYLEL